MTNKARTVKARHVFRKDSNGNPKTKVFSDRVWEMLPKIHQWVNGEKIEYPKMGWVQIAAGEGAPVPEPLKKNTERKAAPTAQAPGVTFE